MSRQHGRSLDRLERWFQDEIVRPHELRSNRSARAKRHADAAQADKVDKPQAWILPSRHLKPRQRVAIYTDMYLLRMVEAMTADYPVVKRLASDRVFEKLVRGYVSAHPSRSYSLNFLGRHFPSFLAGVARVPRKALLVDIARLELAMSEVFDAPGSPVLTSEELKKLPPEVWNDARPRLIEALQVLACDHRANAIVTAIRQDKTLPDLKPEKTWVCVYRKDFVVWRMDLDEPMFAVLRALRENKSLSEAVDVGASVFTGTSEELQANIFRWFSEWVGEGFFSAIE